VSPRLAGMPDRTSTLKKLDTIRIVAAADLALLVVLVFCSLTDRTGGVHVIGPIHGVIFLGLLYLTLVGAGEKRWGWWFPVTTIIPLFALIADARLRRELLARPA
jgi:Domain of unknown function (DUF3817)